MARATWNRVVLAQSDRVERLEGNVYFPPDSVRTEFLRPSVHHTICSWKGVASYYDVVVGDEVDENAAWYYRQPSDAARRIAGYVAFWRGVRVEE